MIGAGVFGAWTAWHLARAGKSVLLVDAWGAGHTRSSSGGETRIIRLGYGADEIYTRMTMRSLDLVARPLRTHRPSRSSTARACYASRTTTMPTASLRAPRSRASDAPHEVVSPDELARRWPQMRLPVPGTYGLFEPESGVLMARRAVAAVVDDAVAHGADYAMQSVAWPNPAIDAGLFVFACGPWLPKLFPALLGSRIHPTRQEVFFFAPPGGNDASHRAALPAWTDFTDPRGPYGVPDIEGRGIKLASTVHGEPFDPDTGDAHGFTRGRRACPPIPGRAIPRAARRARSPNRASASMPTPQTAIS